MLLDLARTATLLIAPHGGQRRARENARRALAAHAERARTGDLRG